MITAAQGAHLLDQLLWGLVHDAAVGGPADVVEQQLAAGRGAAREQGRAVDGAERLHALRPGVQLPEACRANDAQRSGGKAAELPSALGSSVSTCPVSGADCMLVQLAFAHICQGNTTDEAQ